MSTVKLSSFVVYKKPVDASSYPDVRYGSNKVTRGVEGGFLFSLCSIPVSRGIPICSESLFMLYGFRDTLEEVQKRRLEARDLDMEFKSVEMGVALESVHHGIVTAPDLKHIDFINIRRMSACLQSDMLARFQTLVQEEGGDIASMSKVRQIANRPDLWEKVIQADGDMSNIRLMVIPVADGENGRIRYIALVRKNILIASFTYDDEEDQICLPDNFGRSVVVNEEPQEEIETKKIYLSN